MALTTFPDANIPVDWGQAKTSTPKVVEADFGDGYTQRALDGINGVKPTFNVALTSLSLADANTITAFLEARGGYQAFLWTPPNEAQQVFRCKTWTMTPTGAGYANVTAKFIKEFDLNV